VIDSGQTASTEEFHPFEGLWLATKPSGALAWAKVINGELLIPYSFGGEGKLTGHYYGCRLNGKTLFRRFEQFDSAVAGVLLLTIAPNETLKGGRWMNEQISEAVRQDISCMCESLPGMQPTVWVRIRGKETPPWAEKYFLEDWPNKHSN
jgi:hypothetical protein